MGSITKNKSLEIGAVVGGIGLVLTLVSFVYKFAGQPTWMGWWGSLIGAVPGTGDYNLLVMIVGPVLLIFGGYYFGEQLVLRRRFERLIETEKRSDFVASRKQLEELARRLPDGYRQRVKAKEEDFRSRRTA